MAQWYVKELSRLTGVSVQTLHHYDKINLLKPSIRLPNSYRVYSEEDLFRLQQIMALKYSGFNLSTIDKILREERSILYHLGIQAKCLEERASLLLQASAMVKEILAKAENNKSFPWQDIIKMIEVYRMTHQLEKQQVEQAFKNWNAELQSITTDIDLSIDPTSEAGIKIAKKLMDHTNSLHDMKLSLLEFPKEKASFPNHPASGLQPITPMDQATTEWMLKAMQALEQHHRKCVLNILARIDQHEDSVVRQAWDTLLQKMYGDAQTPRKDLYRLLLTDPEISEKAKNWLRSHNL